jgi:hypothetical protein
MTSKTTRIGSLLVLLSLTWLTGFAQAQEGWKRADGIGTSESSPKTADEPTTNQEEPERIHVDPNVQPASGVTGPSRSGFTLPREAGQVWQEYDLSNYTVRVNTTARPEQAVIDWILRETGYEMWHGQPLGILSATPRKLRVYHTPEVQKVVGDIVKRFTGPASQSRSFSFRAVTVNQPNWRVKAQTVLHPMKTQTQGIQAWVLRREDASLLMSELRRRSDFREHSSPHLTVPNGQSTVIANRQPRSYVRNVAYQTGAWTGYRQDSGQIDEGFTFEFSPLLNADGQMIDAVIKCSITRLDKMLPISLNLPSTATNPGSAKVEVPQLSEFNLHERFRWPTEQVLLIDLGMVAVPNTKPGQIIPGIPLLNNGNDRVNLLVFIESRPNVSRTASTPNPAIPTPTAANPATNGQQNPTAARRPIYQATRPSAANYHGRY